jgi:hypothetical protein
MPSYGVITERRSLPFNTHIVTLDVFLMFAFVLIRLLGVQKSWLRSYQISTALVRLVEDLKHLLFV